MKLIIGLGNPGKKYEQTRHNVGFMAIDALLGNWKLEIGNFQNNFESEVWQHMLNDEKIVLVKPQTFMNDSGRAVKEMVNFYKLDPAKDILVLHDEVDLPFGSIRTTESSRSAGQNGVQNIIDELGTQDFHRIRIGVETRGSRNQLGTRDFVLQNFTGDELRTLEKEIFPKIKTEVDRFLKTGN